MNKLQVTTIAVGLVAGMSAHADLLVDRGLPTANLNNVSGADRSNVAWTWGDFTSAASPYTVVGDTFQNNSAQAWSITDIRLWSVGATATADLLGGLSGGSIGIVSPSAVITTPVTYAGGATYQNTSGSFSTISQLDFAVNITLQPGQTFDFFLDGTGGTFGIPFASASNAALSGSPQVGADGLMLIATDTSGVISNVQSWTSDSSVPGANNGGWDKASDLNVQVIGTTAVPEPTTVLAGALLMLPLGFSAVRAFRKQNVA